MLEVVDDSEVLDDNETEIDEDDIGPNIQERLKLRTFVVASKAMLADPHRVKVSDLFREEKSDARS